MPKYVLPPLQPKPAQQPVAVSSVDEPYPREWDRTITLPVNADILAALAVGENVTVTLKGVTESLTNNQSKQGNGQTSVTLEISEVDVYQESPEDQMARGFGRLNRFNRYR